ncbi:MAG: carboxypeptidase-like regulatory domain-containing protein [Chitinophagaceae bacterium]|nr:MAG: carboxypeptidase-like regulatory domain-containing protein [Chitinophagaceae bacterium]
MKSLLPYLLAVNVFLIANVAISQELFINGKVTDASGKALAGCSVYISNTSKGTVTSASGEFSLKNVPEGKYELIVSAIGYQTFVAMVSSGDYPHDLKIRLKPKSNELEEVVVEPIDKGGWRKWGKYFTDNFIGTTVNADHCKLLNPQALRFRFNKKANRLTARANEPLVIENKALGYIVRFQLEEFTATFDDNIVVYLGYPYFREMESNDARKKLNWMKNRKRAFYGSLLHFMRALYRDDLQEQGYMVLAKREDEELTFYSLDTLMKANPDKSKRLFFQNKLTVIYQRNLNRTAEASEIYLDSSDGIDIQPNGSYYSPKGLISNNHWGEYEKLSNMLPFDYTP